MWVIRVLNIFLSTLKLFQPLDPMICASQGKQAQINTKVAIQDTLGWILDPNHPQERKRELDRVLPQVLIKRRA